jgi:SPP1 gp7 family putative phage head morphogenesis protein
MTKPPKTCRPVTPSAAITAAYRKAIQDLIAEMHGSVTYWLTAAMRKAPSRVEALVAQDANPVGVIEKAMRGLRKRWIGRFEEMAPVLAEKYVRETFKRADSAFRSALKDAGWSVEFEMTPAARDAFNASLADSVGLIKSIPEQYLAKVEGSVMRGYSAGRDLESIVKELKSIYPVTNKRAEFIARDQCNKANAVASRTRQLELGITEAIWMHSHAGKTPRPDHLAANGKIYKIAEGCKISGEYIQPGEEINCRCTSRPVLPF